MTTETLPRTALYLPRHRIDPATTGDADAVCRWCGHELEVFDWGTTRRMRHLSSTPACSVEGCDRRAMAWPGVVGRNDAALCTEHTPLAWR